MSKDKQAITEQIKSYALSLGFDFCSICKAEPVDAFNCQQLELWIANDYQADMHYMVRNRETRLDPTKLVEGCVSVVMLALNYYPHEFQNKANPQFAYYAYGKDYHNVIKDKLKQLFEYCQCLDGNIQGRYFCDTAPLLERYWAKKAGLGWIGKHSLLIIPKQGSYFFLAAMLLNIELEYDKNEKTMPDCNNCTKCIDACPTGAIVSPRVINSCKCISYQTIENKDEIDETIIPHLNNRIYGCDICQQVCPWNRFVTPHQTTEFNPSAEFLNLTAKQLRNLDTESYQQIFKGSAIKRAKLTGLKRNIDALDKSNKLI